jgi:hypothetical protein
MESGAALNPGWYFVSGDYWYWDGTRYVYSQTQYTQWHQQFQLGNQWQSQPAQTIHTQSSPNISSHYPGSAASAAAQQPAQQLRTVRDVNEPNLPAVAPPGGLVIRDARGEEIEIPAGWKKQNGSEKYVVYGEPNNPGHHWSIGRLNVASHLTDRAERRAQEQALETNATNWRNFQAGRKK